MSSELKPPIFLLGNVRSGTTMMQKLFALHPELQTWFEPRPVWNYADPGRKWDRFNEADASPKVIRYIRKRFLEYQRKHGGLRIMEKTPANIVRIPYVRKIFPESRFVYLVRHPLAQLNSSELRYRRVIDFHDRRWAWYSIKQTPKTQLLYYANKFIGDLFRKKVLRRQHPRIFGVRYKRIYHDRKTLTTEQIIAKQWTYCSRQVEDDVAKLNHEIIIRIRYEDFVANAVSSFERILRHFGLAMTKEMAEKISKQVDPNRQEKWHRLDPETLRLCLPFLQEEMTRHGYSVPEEFLVRLHQQS